MPKVGNEQPLPNGWRAKQNLDRLARLQRGNGTRRHIEHAFRGNRWLNVGNRLIGHDALQTGSGVLAR